MSEEFISDVKNLFSKYEEYLLLLNIGNKGDDFSKKTNPLPVSLHESILLTDWFIANGLFPEYTLNKSK